MPPDSWFEQRFEGDDLLGGCLNLHVLMHFSSGGVFSVHLFATTFQDDPERFVGDIVNAMDLEAARWMNPDSVKNS